MIYFIFIFSLQITLQFLQIFQHQYFSVTSETLVINPCVSCLENMVGIMQRCPCNVLPLTPHFYIGKLVFTRVYIISSPEPSGSQGELIVYPWSVGLRRRPSSVHIFQTSSPQKPLGRSKPNFMWSLLGEGERKFI